MNTTPQSEPLVKATVPKYDQVLLTCSINPETHKGTAKIIEVLREGIPVSDDLVASDNKSVAQDSIGLSKFWVKTGSAKAGQTYNATENGEFSAKYLVIGSLISEVVKVEPVVDKTEE